MFILIQFDTNAHLNLIAVWCFTEVLQDWRLLTDLLLVDKSAPDLTSNQQTILLRLLVASVRKITMEDSKKKAATDRVSFVGFLCSIWCGKGNG